jgi:hypothetical protein
MAKIEHYFFVLMIIAALIDRFVFMRKSVKLKGVGHCVTKGTVLAFPVSLDIRCGWISDAQIEYWLQDLNDPSVVITGKSRTINTAITGLRQEYLLINSRYLDAGRWDLRVKITNGNCRINPLYRIFPIHEVMEKQYTVSVSASGGWDVKQ